MHFQYTFFELQDYLTRFKQENPTSAHYEAFDRLSEFLPKMLQVLHIEATAIYLEFNPSPLPAAVKQKLITGLQEKSKQAMSEIWQPGNEYLFAALDLFLQQPANSHLSELKLMVSTFNALFKAKDPSAVTVFMRMKLKKSRVENLFEFQKDVAQVREKFDFIKTLSGDPTLAALVADENYPFTKQHLFKLSEAEYALIRANKIACLFLLAGFGVNELDPNLSKILASIAAADPINPLDHSDAMDVEGIIQLAECARKNIGLEHLKELLRLCYQSDDFKIRDVIWALRVANTITCGAPQTLTAFFERLRAKIPPFDIAIKESRILYIKAREELNTDLPYAEVYASYKKAPRDADPRLMPTDIALRESIRNFESLDQHSAQLKLIGYSDLALKHLLDRAVANFRSAATVDERKVSEPYIWAALRELLERKTGVALRCNQMLNAYLILNTSEKRTVAQIRVGEGGPAIQAIMMAFCALTTGNKQYCAEDSVYGAEHNTAFFKSFYSALGLTSACNVSSAAQIRDPLREDSYLGNIVYGTADAFRIGYLALLARGLEDYFNPAEVTFHAANVAPLLAKDEHQLGDTGFVEKRYEPTRLYHDIWEYFSSYRETPVRGATYSNEGLQAYLIEKKYFTEKTIASTLNQFRIRQWYKHAILVFSLEKGVHYHVKPSVYDEEPAIVIAGSENDIDEWPGGLHQLVCARDGLRVTKERHIKGFIRQHQFFNLFSGMCIITNTLGGKAANDYLVNTYLGTTILSLPEFRPSKARFIAPTVSNGVQAQYQQLMQDIVQAKRADQPLLLLFKTIKEMSDFYSYAISHGQIISLCESSSDIKVGSPGSVFCATFDSCQFDVVPTPEAEVNGGLGVLLCSPPETESEALLYFAKTGQQGRNGFYGFRLEREELLQKTQQADVPNELLFESWMKKLKANEESINQDDAHNKLYADLIFALQKLIYDFKNEKLIAVYTDYLGMILDDIKEFSKQASFFSELSKVVLEMMQCAEVDITSLENLSQSTHNVQMSKWLSQMRAQPSMRDVSSGGIVFFTSAPSAAAVSSANPSSKRAFEGPGH